jgi:hypothetical protein
MLGTDAETSARPDESSALLGATAASRILLTDMAAGRPHRQNSTSSSITSSCSAFAAATHSRIAGSAITAVQ